MSTKVNIFSGIVKYSVSTWINFVLGIASVIITTRLLTPSVYGQISIFLSISSVLMYVFTFGTDSALIRFYNEPPQGNSINQVIYKCLILITTVAAVFCVVSAFSGEEISLWLFKCNSKKLCFALILQAWCSVVMRYLNISYRMSFKVREYTIQNIILNSAARLSIIIGAFISEDFIFIILLSTIVLLIITFYYMIIQSNQLIPYSCEDVQIKDYTFNFKGYHQFMRYAMLSAPTYIIVNFNIYLNQQIILELLGTYALGIFSSTTMFSKILLVMKGGFGTFWSAFVYKYYKIEHERIKKMSDYILIISILSLSIIVFARDFIYLFIGPEFHSSISFFSLLLLYPIINFILEATGKGIELKKKNEITLWAYIASIISNLLGAFFLIPIIGVQGAAISNAISGLVLYIIITFYSQKYYITINSVFKNFMGIMCCVVLATIPFLTTRMVFIVPLNLFIIIISFIIFKSEYITLYKYVVQRVRKIY